MSVIIANGKALAEKAEKSEKAEKKPAKKTAKA